MHCGSGDFFPRVSNVVCLCQALGFCDEPLLVPYFRHRIVYRQHLLFTVPFIPFVPEPFFNQLQPFDLATI